MLIPRRHLLIAAAGFAVTAPAFGLTRKQRASRITVRAARGDTTGTLRFNGRDYACALGRSGIVDNKHEGDGGTPAGIFPLREIRYRPDRLALPKTGLPVIPTTQAADPRRCLGPVPQELRHVAGARLWHLGGGG